MPSIRNLVEKAERVHVFACQSTLAPHEELSGLPDEGIGRNVGRNLGDFLGVVDG